jgi:hypothetical protein
MREINSREDYEAIVDKYAARLKVARAKYEDFKKEIAVVEKVLGASAPSYATDAERKEYNELVAESSRRLKNFDRYIADYDDFMDDAARTVKLFR